MIGERGRHRLKLGLFLNLFGQKEFLEKIWDFTLDEPDFSGIISTVADELMPSSSQ
jgi:hypothetical protein